MQAFTQLHGLVVPLDRSNVDTDAIIPKQYLKSIKRTGFGPHLFDDWRYLDPGQPGESDQEVSQRRPNPEFALNQSRYAGAQIMLARDNLGCGSSREHAAWAFLDYGIRCIIAPSFADIFYGNCGKNGILLIQLDGATVDGLFQQVFDTPGYRLSVDLESQIIGTPSGEPISFSTDPSLRYRLLNGLDEIDITLQYADAIKSYEQRRMRAMPWLFTVGGGSEA